MAGYQMDNNRNTDWAVRLYEEHGRETLAFRGKKAVIDAAGKSTLSDIPEAGGPAWFELDQWHEYDLICQGSHLLLKVKRSVGRRGARRRPQPSGVIGLVGGCNCIAVRPMTVQFKDIRLKHLQPANSR